jgi:DnaJ-class molecular chaperone
MQVQIQQLGPGMIQQIQSMCSECRGQGERINPKDRCKTCQGKKVCVASLQTLQQLQVRMCHLFLYRAHWRSNK